MSWRLRLLNAQLRLTAKPVLRRMDDPAAARLQLDRAARWVFRPVPYLRRARVGALEWISAGPVRQGKVILYLHGGAYIAGTPGTHAQMLGRLSRLSGIEVCASDYRLAPETPFPAAVDDAGSAWTHLRTLGYAPADIAIAGDSAGGGLALALAAQVCQLGEPPAAVYAMSPWTDLTLASESLQTNAGRDVLLPVERIEEVIGYYLGGADPADPRASPLLAEFPGAPPTLLQYSETEVLRDDSRRMAERLRAFGATVLEETEADAPHVWQLFDGIIPEARASLRRGARFLQDSLADSKR